MANTYTLISSNVLSSSAASVTFSSIPSTYTDLVLRWSARTDGAGTVENLSLVFNSDSATNYSHTRIRGNGATASSGRNSSGTVANINLASNAADSTANTFSSGEIYLPSYTVAQNKPFSAIHAQEDNSTTANIVAEAELWRNTAAVTSFVLSATSNFVSGSSFYLYGIKNS